MKIGGKTRKAYLLKQLRSKWEYFLSFGIKDAKALALSRRHRFKR